jgi:putative transposase
MPERDWIRRRSLPAQQERYAPDGNGSHRHFAVRDNIHMFCGSPHPLVGGVSRILSCHTLDKCTFVWYNGSMRLTAQINILTTPESHKALLETMRVFNLACQFVSDYAFEHKVFNKRNLQELLYDEVRARFCLSSQLAVRLFGKVGDAYRASLTQLRKRQAKYDALSKEKQANRKRPELRVCKFRNKGAVVYDSRLLTYDTPGTITLRALKGRLSLPVQFPKGLDRSTIRGEADLILQGNTFYLLQTVEVEAMPPYATTKYLGVDQGMVHIAYDSDGIAYDSPLVEKRRLQYEVRRTGLKQKKTKNSRRALKKMGKKLARFRKDVNHGISKRLVQKAKALGQGLAMENLTNFFDKTKVKVRRNRRLGIATHKWSELEGMFRGRPSHLEPKGKGDIEHDGKAEHDRRCLSRGSARPERQGKGYTTQSLVLDGVFVTHRYNICTSDAPYVETSLDGHYNLRKGGHGSMRPTNETNGLPKSLSIRTMPRKCGIAYGMRILWQQRLHSSPRVGNSAYMAKGVR